jgi:hypothetical protein
VSKQRGTEEERTEGQTILTAKPAGPPFRPAAGKVEDLSPYPGLGAARSDDTTTNKHRTSTQHRLLTPHVCYMGNAHRGNCLHCHIQENHDVQSRVIQSPCPDKMSIKNVESGSECNCKCFTSLISKGRRWKSAVHYLFTFVLLTLLTKSVNMRLYFFSNVSTYNTVSPLSLMPFHCLI